MEGIIQDEKATQSTREPKRYVRPTPEPSESSTAQDSTEQAVNEQETALLKVSREDLNLEASRVYEQGKEESGLFIDVEFFNDKASPASWAVFKIVPTDPDGANAVSIQQHMTSIYESLQAYDKSHNTHQADAFVRWFAKQLHRWAAVADGKFKEVRSDVITSSDVNNAADGINSFIVSHTERVNNVSDDRSFDPRSESAETLTITDDVPEVKEMEREDPTSSDQQSSVLGDW